jgi:hypothetical protein
MLRVELPNRSKETHFFHLHSLNLLEYKDNIKTDPAEASCVDANSI